ncbi:MAG: DUF2336 domain-containing protein [Alphaproteobacteria bacterium]|nr:DUF2336 domain-containing protein [Alphaproteobacteria bacterium]
MFIRHMLRQKSAPRAQEPDTVAHLTALLNLARQPSGPTRARLLSDIADIFLARWPKLGPSERALIGEILARLAPSGEPIHRRALARRVAALHEPPLVLARLLAEDLPEIAEAILRKGPILPDKDLVDIVGTRGRDHRLAIASQRFLAAPVALALVERGEEEVILRLLANDQAHIGPAAFALLVESARENRALRIPLLTRHDLPVGLMNRLFLVVGRAERKFIVAENAARLPAEAGGEDWRRQGTLEAKRRRLREARLVEILRLGTRPELARAMSGLAGISLARAEEIVADPSCEPMAIFAKACGIDRATFSTFVLLSEPEGRRSLHETYDRLSLYEEVSEAIAERILDDWRDSPAAQDEGARRSA